MKIHKSFIVLVIKLAPILLFNAGRLLAQNAPAVVPRVVVVQFEAGIYLPGKTVTTGLQDFDRKAAVYGAHTIERMYPFLDHVEPTPETQGNLMALRRTYYVRYSADVNPERVSRDLALSPGTVYAEPVPVSRILGPVRWERIDPNDPGFTVQTYLQALKIPGAWDTVKGSDGYPRVVIAIVDGGGEWRHEDLRANVWTNKDEIPGNGVDDDNNGFIDDVHGVNFANSDDTNNDPTGLPGTPRNAAHGTAVAGVASAVTNNNLGVAGAAWNAELMHINAGCPDDDGLLCSSYSGILYAAMNGGDIINASWGSIATDDREVRHLDQTLDLATDMGALVVTSAGNRARSLDTFREYPARHPRVLTVGATQGDTRVKAGFSNFGRLVNVFAPGIDIITTGPENGYVRAAGTSYASALTAGVVALAKTWSPDLSPDALREQVRLASENIDAENPGFAGYLGRGFVNALAAVQVSTLPAIRIRRWSWEDHDGDRIIEPSDRVTILMTVVNHLADANQLRVELVGAEPYSSVQWITREVEVGRLANGDSVQVVFEFTVASNALADQQVRFFANVRDGAFEDVADLIVLRINRQIERVHQGLSAFYVATDGDNWTRNDNWDITTIPTEEELARWFGISLNEGLLVQLLMGENNLRGAFPPEIGNLRNVRVLALFENEELTGSIPPEVGKLEQLQILDLPRNTLSGPIPSELGNLEQLQILGLSRNTLSGSIPSELGNLEQLQILDLSRNTFSGPIPYELGNLEQLQILDLSRNTFSGPIPSELGNLSRLKRLVLSRNALTGQLPRSLMQLDSLEVFHFGDQKLCAPADDEFHMWLHSIPNQSGSTCMALHFAGDISDQSFPRTVPITPLTLPESRGGISPITYFLTPMLPTGLIYDSPTRTISGTPTEVTSSPIPFTFKATDATGATDSLVFSIEVFSPVSSEQAGSPESFTVYENYGDYI